MTYRLLLVAAVGLVIFTRLINAGILWPIEFDRDGRVVRDPLFGWLR